MVPVAGRALHVLGGDPDGQLASGADVTVEVGVHVEAEVEHRQVGGPVARRLGGAEGPLAVALAREAPARRVERGVGDDLVGRLLRRGVPGVGAGAHLAVDAGPVDVHLGVLGHRVVAPHVAEAGVVGAGVAPAGGVEAQVVAAALLAPAEAGAQPRVPDGAEPVEVHPAAAPVGRGAAALFEGVAEVDGLVPALAGAGGDVLGALGREGDPLLEAEADPEGVGDRVAELAAQLLALGGRVEGGADGGEFVLVGTEDQVLADGAGVSLGEVVRERGEAGAGQLDALAAGRAGRRAAARRRC